MSGNITSVSKKELDRRNFILTGNIWKVVFTISFPLFLYSLFQYLYSFVDVLLANQISKEASDCVSMISQFTTMVQSIGDGLAAGGAILIAREIGKNNYQRAKSLSSTLFVYIFVITILTDLIFIPFAKPIMRMNGLTDDLINVGYNYFIINIVNSSIVIVNSVFIGLQKAKGSTKSISIFNIMIVFIKIGLSYLFVYGLNLKDTTYIALATLCANATLFVIMLCGYMFRKSYLFHFSFKNVDFSFKTGKKVTLISFPIFLGKFVFSFGKSIINTMTANKFPNQGVVGALGVSNSIGGMGTKAMSSIEDSTSSIISQNIGNGNYKRALQTFYVGLVYNVLLGVIAVILLTVFNNQIISFYTQNITDPASRATREEMISEIFFYEKMGIITLGINSAVLGLLYGFGYTKISMVINLLRVFGFRVPSLVCMFYIFPNFGIDYGWKAVGIAMGFSNIMIGIVAIIVAIIIVVKIKKQEQKRKELQNMIDQAKKQKVEKFIKNYLNEFTFYKKEKNIKWCYEDGIVLNGAMQLYKTTKDKFYLDFVVNHFDQCIQADGTILTYSPQEKNIDNVEEGMSLFLLNQIKHEDKYDKALKSLEYQLTIMPRTKSGSFWHKDIYPNQIWLDGLYMGMPFYASVTCRDHSIKQKDDIINQFKNVERYNYEPSLNSFMHCYDETKSMQWASKETGRSPNVWLRSVGWLGMASSDVYEIFKEGGFSLSKRYLKGFLQKVIATIEPLEDKNTHLYYDLPLLPNQEGNYLETSGSLMIAYAYLKGARLKMLDSSASKKGAIILESVIDNYLTETELKNVCKVSGLDGKKRNGSVEYYLSEEVCSNDSKGVAPLMMAYSEYLKVCK